MRRITFPAITILLICLVFTLPVNLNAYLFGNEGDSAYMPPPQLNVGASICSITLRQLIADGGSHFFMSSGQINKFFSLVESSEITGTDYNGLQKTINGAIYYLEKARATYFQLKNLAAVTPYNQEVIYSLIHFDYDSFQEVKGLFPYVFVKVKDFLSIGDVTGVFNEFYLYTGQILDLMYTIKKDIDAGMFPNLSIVWCVNQTYSDFKLFGQYTAQVFYSIK